VVPPHLSDGDKAHPVGGCGFLAATENSRSSAFYLFMFVIKPNQSKDNAGNS